MRYLSIFKEKPKITLTNFINNSKIVINIKSEKEARLLFTKLKERDLRWNNGWRISPNITNWERYGENTIYIYYSKQGLKFGFWDKHKYPIALELSEIDLEE